MAKIIAFAAIITISLNLSSCLETEDPGPLQDMEKHFSIVDFDRIEVGDAFHVTVEQSEFFEISFRGDRRNIDDLSVTNEGSTLVIEFDENRNRRHDTFVTIKMPALLSANFSGATDSKVSGFNNVAKMKLLVSGASVCQVSYDAQEIQAFVSGGSVVTISGEGNVIRADVSGASILKAFNFPVETADVSASGASSVQVAVSDNLSAVASGASVVRYQGNPAVVKSVSGASKVVQD